MLMPGFIESHMHPMAAGSRYLACPLNNLAWPGEVLAKLERCAAGLQGGEWLRATGLADGVLAGVGPGTAVLDKVSGGRAAMVSNRFSHAVWLNSEALSRAGIDSATVDPEGGEIVRDQSSGMPTGVLRAAAVNLVWQLASDFSQDEFRQGLRRASQLANSLGITTSNDGATMRAHWEAYRAAEQAGEMTLRVNASLRWYPELGLDQLRSLEEMRDQSTGPLFRADSVKLFVDGGAEGTANLLQPYLGTEYYGLSNFGDRLTGIVEHLDAAGFQLKMHAYGDQAVRDGLDAIQHAMQTNASRERRHQLAHVALIDPADVPRFAELGVTADIQPLWAWGSEVRERECESFGPERCQHFLAFRDLFDSGIRVVAGSDWISDSMSPLYGIQVAVTRRPPDGSGPAWNPDQRVTLEEILKAYTIDGAWLYGQEDLTGSIEVGKAADLIVLDRNLFEVDPMAIKDVAVLLTLLEGEVVYQLEPMRWPDQHHR
jgi:predicted amidohydrolase YtcJ